jgi:hypothetical protein
MAKPSTRQELVDYCLRKLGYPVLEINIADEQIDDLVDDALQFFYERHFDGVIQNYLKYRITQDDIDRGKGKVGITTSIGSETINGIQTQYDFKENSNYLPIPPNVIGVNKIFKFEGANSISSGMFSVKYQLFLNDFYYWGNLELLTYSMIKTKLEDIDFLLNTNKQIRFNKRQDRLYLDIDWNSVKEDQWLIIDCYQIMDPNSYSEVWNDSFLKPYLTALMKRQWGYNISNKFRGLKLPGGVELDGRTLVEDAQREIDSLMDKMSSTYELPPLDMIG